MISKEGYLVEDTHPPDFEQHPNYNDITSVSNPTYRISNGSISDIVAHENYNETIRVTSPDKPELGITYGLGEITLEDETDHETEVVEPPTYAVVNKEQNHYFTNL